MLMATMMQEERREKTFGLPVLDSVTQGSALAQARVKHRTGAGRSGLPGLPRHDKNQRRHECQARADARASRAPSGG